MSSAQSLFLMLFTTLSIATNGFGALPDSELSKNFRQTLSEILPTELLFPINDYLQEMAVATLPVLVDVVDEAPAQDPNTLAEELAEEMAAAIVREQGQDPGNNGTAPEESPIPLTASPTPAVTPSPTTTPIAPTPTSEIVYIPPTPTDKPTSNTAPTCTNLNYTNTQSTTPQPVDLNTYCSDPDGDIWSISSASAGSNGPISFSGTTLNYTPNNGFVGADNVTFTVKDTNNNSRSYTLNITINNGAPIANDTSLNVLQNSSGNNLSLSISDPGNDALTVTTIDTISTGMTGTAVIAPGGQSITYTPISGGIPAGGPPPTGQGFTGTESLIYTIEDSHGATATATLYIETKVPFWCAETTGDANSGCLTSNILLNGALQTSLVVQPGNTFTFQFDYKIWTSDPSNIVQVFPIFDNTPASTCALSAVVGNYPGYSNTSSVFTFTAPASSGYYNLTVGKDYHLSCADALTNYTSLSRTTVGTVRVNSSPTCSGFNHSTQEDAPQQTVNIQALCSDADGDPFTITSATNSLGATAGIISHDNNNIYYTPAVGFTGTDVITFTIDDSISPAYTQNFNMIIHPKPVIIFSANGYPGDMGNRSATDTLCANNNPTTYANTTAFISHSAADSIANIPTNYLVETNRPIKSNSGTQIASNWADVLDGNIATSLSGAGVTSNAWWSGAQSWDGSHIDGTTNDCNDWTSNLDTVGGIVGSANNTDSSWITLAPAGCHQSIDLLCIAYP